jgi:hypothetical protein
VYLLQLRTLHSKLQLLQPRLHLLRPLIPLCLLSPLFPLIPLCPMCLLISLIPLCPLHEPPAWLIASISRHPEFERLAQASIRSPNPLFEKGLD